MFDCILLMAGVGSRTSLPYNKIKYVINDKPLYRYSLDIFLGIKELNKMILVVNKADYDEFKTFETGKILVTIGGDNRQDSVKNGLKLSTSETVLIHDAARPNILTSEVMDVYHAATKCYASVLAYPCTNAIKEVKDGFVTKSLDRNNLWIMQTPQGANRELLMASLDKIDHLIYDDIQAIEEIYKINAKIVLGRSENIKVTTASDLEYIKVLLGKNNG